VVYSTRYCGFCHRAADLLRREGIAFQVVDVTDDLRARARLVERAHGRRTVPVVFVDDEPIGGYQELAAMVATRELNRRLTETSDSPGARSAAGGPRSGEG
jgi:glutaredoxin 3